MASYNKLTFYFYCYVNNIRILLCVSEMEEAVKVFNGRFFGGRRVTAQRYDQELYDINDLSR